jgi:hypothetical protein
MHREEDLMINANGFPNPLEESRSIPGRLKEPGLTGFE